MFDLVAKYYYAFRSDDQSFHLLSEIEKYVNGVEIQAKRLEKFKERMHKQKGVKRLSHDQLFLDCHFYFICLDKIDKFMDKLSSKLKNKKLEKLKKEFKSTFRASIRHDLEHLDERVLGQKWGKIVKNQNWKQDFLNFYSSPKGDFLSFGGQQFAVGKSERLKLRKIFRQLILIIHRDYALKDKEFISRLLQEKRIEFILKRIEKR